MESTSLLIALSLLTVAPPQPQWISNALKATDAYHILLPRRVVGAGEHVELRLVPPAPNGVEVNWAVDSGTGGHALNPPGVYRAPLVIPLGTPPAKVGAAFEISGIGAGATTEIELAPSSVPGAADCLGPGQMFSTVLGDIIPRFTPVDVLPELVHRVDPVYPRSAIIRGVEETIPINALVCRSGRVLDAYALASYRDTRDANPVERDPELVEAALAAVRQYLFKPAMAAGQPIAVWVGIPVRFRR